MAKLSEMPFKAQLGIIVAVAVVVTGALYFFMYKEIATQNAADVVKLRAKKAENDQLRPYADKIVDLERQIASLKQQLEIQRRIVPDEKEAENFMHLMQDTASSAGIEIRRYTSKSANTKEYYTEVPFEMELDGPYYSLLSFFDKAAKLERIINIGGLHMGGVTAKTDLKTKRKYQYAPGESVIALCTATTFFSHDQQQAAPAPAKGSTPAPAAAAAPAAAPAKK